jgi:hypothetical protein
VQCGPLHDTPSFPFLSLLHLAINNQGRIIFHFNQEHDPTLKRRVKKNDALEMQSFYQHYNSKYIHAVQSADKADR